MIKKVGVIHLLFMADFRKRYSGLHGPLWQEKFQFLKLSGVGGGMRRKSGRIKLRYEVHFSSLHAEIWFSEPKQACNIGTMLRHTSVLYLVHWEIWGNKCVNKKLQQLSKKC